ncbi:MAG: hypothetical protein LR015_02725 [Verrucomicrobia bacterium]|nr:hypothetical protein [Verrucomicrobiota bacterium]
MQNDIAWIDPRGLDVTLDGMVGKSVLLNAATVATNASSLIDTSGGGDLFGFRWIPGVGGTRDILDTTGSYAIIPGYNLPYAPNESFNTSASGGVLSGIGAFANNSLTVGDQVQLDASTGLPAGTYTLLPARYALLPGAFLLTPRNSPPTRAVTLPEGTELVAGSRVNALTGVVAQNGLRSQFELVSSAALDGRAEYVRYSATDFLSKAAEQRGFNVQRLPADAGQTVFSATNGLDLLGALAAVTPTGARGGLVDINSPRSIAITDVPVVDGVLQLRPEVLNSFDAASLLVGGVRSFANGNVRITTNAPEIVVSNQDTSVVANDLILVARDGLTLTESARLQSLPGSAVMADPVVLGSADIAGSGDGLLVRVSSASEASVTRQGIGTGVAQLQVDAGAQVRAESLVLDSSSATTLNPEADLVAGAVTLSSSEIAIAAPGTDLGSSSAGLVVSDAVLESIQNSTSSLTLQAYQSLQLFGSYILGGDTFDRIELRTPVVRGVGLTSDVFQLKADTLVLSSPTDTLIQSDIPSATGAERLHFQLQSNTLELDPGKIALQQFASVGIEARSSVLISGQGSLESESDLTIATPLIAAVDRSEYELISNGALVVAQPEVSNITSTRDSALAASLRLQGSSVNFSSDVFSTLRRDSGSSNRW